MKRTFKKILALGMCAIFVIGCFYVLPDAIIGEDCMWQTMINCGSDYARIDLLLNFVPSNEVVFFASIRELSGSGEPIGDTNLVEIARITPNSMKKVRSCIIKNLKTDCEYKCSFSANDEIIQSLIPEKKRTVTFYTQKAYSKKISDNSMIKINSPQPNDIFVVGDKIKISWDESVYNKDDKCSFLIYRQSKYETECSNDCGLYVHLGDANIKDKYFETEISERVMESLKDGNLHETDTDYFYSLWIGVGKSSIEERNLPDRFLSEFVFSIINLKEPMVYWPKEP